MKNNNLIFIKRIIQDSKHISGVLSFLNMNFKCFTLEENENHTPRIPKGQYIAENQLSLEYGKIIKIYKVSEEEKDNFYYILTPEERLNKLKEWKQLTNEERKRKLKNIEHKSFIHTGMSVKDFIEKKSKYNYKNDATSGILIGESIEGKEDIKNNIYQILHNSNIVMNQLFNLLHQEGGICELIIGD